MKIQSEYRKNCEFPYKRCSSAHYRYDVEHCDYENELIDKFFGETKMLNMQNIESLVDSFFDYIRRNSENYKILCRSNDFLFAAKRIRRTRNKRIYRRAFVRVRQILPRFYERNARKALRIHEVPD